MKNPFAQSRTGARYHIASDGSYRLIQPIFRRRTMITARVNNWLRTLTPAERTTTKGQEFGAYMIATGGSPTVTKNWRVPHPVTGRPRITRARATKIRNAINLAKIEQLLNYNLMQGKIL